MDQWTKQTNERMDAPWHAASETMVGWQSAANFGTGFTAGLGGLITLPVTLPATLAASVTTSLRLAFAVAIVGGGVGVVHSLKLSCVRSTGIEEALN